MKMWQPIRDESGRVKTLFNDLVVKYEICNFCCKYCLNQMQPDKTKIWLNSESNSIASIILEDVKEEMVYSARTTLGKRLDALINELEKNIDAAILRISGGEILRIKNIEDFLKKVSSRYLTIQIVTNGYYLVPSLADKLKEIGNVQIHFSLDGHNIELNENRVEKQIIQDRLLKNLDYLIQKKLPVEISCILTKSNTRRFREYLDYLMKYRGKLCVLPAPIRGEYVNKFFPCDEDVREYAKIIDYYDVYSEILPPKSYIEEEIKFMLSKVRLCQCQVPKIAIQSLDTGAVTPCPNGWSVQLGNVFKDGSKKIADAIGTQRIYSVLMYKRPRIDFCKGCYTAYDVSNLYLLGKISDEELRRMKLFSHPQVYNRLKEIKEHNELYMS